MLDSVTDLRALLKDPTLLPNKAYVAGEWVDAADGATFAVTNPARGDIIARVPDLTRADAARAIAAADKARHEWAARTGKERAAILRKWYDLCLVHQPWHDPDRRAGQTPARSEGRSGLRRKLYRMVRRRGQAHLR